MHKLATEQERIRRLGVLTIGQVLLLSFAEASPPFFLATVPLQTLLTRHEWRKWQLKRLAQREEESERIAAEAALLLERAKPEA